MSAAAQVLGGACRRAARLCWQSGWFYRNRRPQIPIWATRRSISADTSAFPAWMSLGCEDANPPGYPAGTGSAAIFHNIPANSRRVR